MLYARKYSSFQILSFYFPFNSTVNRQVIYLEYFIFGLWLSRLPDFSCFSLFHLLLSDDFCPHDKTLGHPGVTASSRRSSRIAVYFTPFVSYQIWPAYLSPQHDAATARYQNTDGVFTLFFFFFLPNNFARWAQTLDISWRCKLQPELPLMLFQQNVSHRAMTYMVNVCPVYRTSHLKFVSL